MQAMLSRLQQAPSLRLPAHGRLLPSGVRPFRSAAPGRRPAAGGRGQLLSRASLQSWWDPERRRLLQGVFVGVLGAAMFGRNSSALAASRVEQVLENVKWPDDFPFTDEDFKRYDETPDTFFYGQPRFVTHIDDGAIAALTKYYSQTLPSGKDVAVLDMCSSWISHYPQGYTAGKITGLGMNREELQRNPVLTDFDVQDLNVDPKLPYDDNTYDVITNVVSVDYLSKPIEIFKEMHRVLKPGGMAIMSFSNRCFPTKAISIWTSTGDPDHAWIIGAYFHYSVPGGFTSPEAKDISPGPKGLFGGSGDPMYIVQAQKEA